jgi:hypothetical protein
MNGLYQPHSDPLTDIRSSLNHLSDTFPDGDYSANMHQPTSQIHAPLSNMDLPPYHSTAPIPFNHFTEVAPYAPHDPEALDDLLGPDN